MSFFAIRDDDTSFFTSPEELDSVYSQYWGKVPISLAVVPFSVPEHRGRSFNSSYPADVELPLGENEALVHWLIGKIRLGEVEVMLHGFNHQYRKLEGRWVGEFGWKSRSQLISEVLKGKTYLEKLLETKIKIFVPPSNTISKDGVVAIRNANLDLSGIMGAGGDRPVTLDYLFAYVKRWSWRLKHGDAYPFPLFFGGSRELRAYALTPRAKPDDLIKNLDICAKNHAPFVVATHYWEFRDCPEMHKTLSRLIERARELNMIFKPVSRCFGRADEC